MKRFLAVFCMAAIIFSVSGCKKGLNPTTSTFVYFDTVVTLTVYNGEIPQEAWDLCRKFDKLFSATNKDSELYKLNKNGSLKVSPETQEVINIALEYCRETKGQFDITVRPLSELWNFTSETPAVPSPKDITAALELINYENIEVKDNLVTLPKGVKIDLGAIAKGYISDKLCEVYKSRKLSGIIDLGGNITVVGSKPDGSLFTVGIKSPFEEGEQVGVLNLNSGAISTCGTYERFFVKDGQRYHHILDTKTGYPKNTELESVTVIAPDSTTADALSTSLFLMGETDALKYIENRKNVEAVFITADGSLHLSPGLKMKGDNIYLK